MRMSFIQMRLTRRLHPTAPTAAPRTRTRTGSCAVEWACVLLLSPVTDRSRDPLLAEQHRRRSIPMEWRAKEPRVALLALVIACDVYHSAAEWHASSPSIRIAATSAPRRGLVSQSRTAHSCAGQPAHALWS